MAEDLGAPSARAQEAGSTGTLAPGTRVAGYVIEDQIGAGGMAVVYRARDDVLGRLVAVKVLAPTLASDEEFRVRFLRESRAVAAVDESHIVPVYGAGDADGLLYIATRFVADGDLGRRQRAAGGPLPPAQAADIIAQVASALDAAHAVGLVHRDVKPANILVESIPGRPEHAYLSDFGLSKSTTSVNTGLTAVGRFMGTPDYCAPEQITGGAIDGRGDQYSLACVAFTLLAGAVPFNRGDSMARLFAHVNSPVPALAAIRPDLPPAATGVLARGMAKNPTERFESCAAFARALRGALGFATDNSQGNSLPPRVQPSFPGQGAAGYQPTVALAGQQHPSVPPASPPGWQNPAMPVGPAGWQVPSAPQDSPHWRQQPMDSPPAPGSFPPNAGGPAMVGPGQPWRSGPGQAPPGQLPPSQLPSGPGQAPPGPGQLPSGPGQVRPGPGPSRRRRPPGRNTGLLIGSSIAGVVLLAGAIVGVTLSLQHGPAPTPSPTGSSSPSATGQVSPGPVANGTATLAGSLTAPGAMSYAFFSADGKYVAGTSTKSDVYVWSTSTMQSVNTLSVAANDTVAALGFSPDDSTMYALDTTTSELYVLNIASGKQLHAYPLPSDASLGYSYTYDGSVIDALYSDGTVKEYDMATDTLYATVKNPDSSPIVTTRPSGDGRYVLLSDKNGKAYLMDARSGQVTQTFQYPYSTSSSAMFPQLTLDGNTVDIPGGSAGPAKIWNATTNGFVTPADPLWPTPDDGVTFSTDSKFELTSPTTVSETVDIWNIATRAHVVTVTVPGGANEGVESIGPGASELLATSGLNMTKLTFSKLDIWAVPG